MDSFDLKNLKKLERDVRCYERHARETKILLGERYVSFLKDLIPDIDSCLDGMDYDNLWLTSEKFDDCEQPCKEGCDLSELLKEHWGVNVKCGIQVTEEIAEKIKQMGGERDE